MDSFLQKTAFLFVHYSSIWLIAAFFLSGTALWKLAALLHQHGNRVRETRFAFLCALTNIGLGTTLWILRMLLG